MLLRSIHLNLDGRRIVLAENVLHGVEIVLAHIAQTTTVVVPVAAEGLVGTVDVVGLEGSRTEPHVVVKLCRDGFGLQVLLAHPEEFPGEARSTADGNLQRPTQHTAVNELLQGLNRCAETIERVSETEPGVQAEDAVVLLHSLHHALTLADGTGHGLLAPDVLAGFGSLNTHQRMPMGRRSDVDDIHIGVVDEVTEIVIRDRGVVETLLGHVDSLLQMLLVHITDGYQTATLVAGEVITAAPDTSDADDTLGELVAWCHMLGSTQHTAWDNGEQRGCSHRLQKFSSFHILLTEISFLTLNY